MSSLIYLIFVSSLIYNFLFSLACFTFVNTGFRSRVKYLSIVDPTQMAYYISEILDAGPQGPLFMVNCSLLYHLYICSSVSWYMLLDALQVTLENCPGELFINVSPTKCWSMVRERLNMEIRRQLSMGRANLPALQPPGSVDGFEMFGLLSPSIVQVRKPFTWPHSETHYISRNEKKRRNTETHQLHEKWNLFQGCITVWWFTHSSRCCHMLGLLSV